MLLLLEIGPFGHMHPTLRLRPKEAGGSRCNRRLPTPAQAGYGMGSACVASVPKPIAHKYLARKLDSTDHFGLRFPRNLLFLPQSFLLVVDQA